MKVVLLPCKLREDHLVPVKGAASKTYPWEEFRDLLQSHLPAKERRGVGAQERLRILGRVQAQGYVGRVRSREDPKVLNLFFISNQDHSGSLSSMLDRDPDFLGRVVDAYLVEQVILDHVVRFEAFDKEPFEVAGRAGSALSG